MSLKSVRILAIAGVLSIAPTLSYAKQFLYVQNARSGDVSVISVPEHELVDIIPNLPRPDDVIGSPDGRTLFVNLHINDVGHDLNASTSGEIVAIDTKTHDVKWRMKTDGTPEHLAMSKNGLLYFPYFDRPYVHIVDTNSQKIVGRLDALWGMHSLALADDEKHLYVGSMFTRSLYVFDLVKGKLEKIVDFADGVRPVVAAKDNSVVYAQRSGLHGFDVVDLAKGEVVKTVHLPALPDDFEYPTQWPHNVNHGLGLSPDQKYVFAAGSVANYVAVYRHPDLEYVKTIPICTEPNWITFSPDSSFAYVGCRGSNEVSVIDMTTLEEVKRVKTNGVGSARLRVIDVPDE